jgi:hypothetical protein
MKALDRKTLKKFISTAGDRLKGNWVLVGGTLLHALEEDYRSTTDIDVVGIDAPDQGETLKLMEIAGELDLPVDSINQAAAFFLLKIPHFKDHLIPLHRGKKAVIFRPDVELYIRLKAARMKETDLDDCLAYLKGAKTRNEKVDLVQIEKLLISLEKKAAPAQKERLKDLLRYVRKFHKAP